MFAVRFARVWRLASLAGCALLGACASHSESGDRKVAKGASATSAPASTQTLLHFDWGRELDADVFATREEFAIKGDSERISRLEAQFHVHAQRLDDRYVLTFSELRMKLDDKPIPEN